MNQYATVLITHDGPGNSWQITYGRSEVKENGDLKRLLERYIYRGGFYAKDFRPYLLRIDRECLAQCGEFRQLLKDAGTCDSIMQQVQDEFYEGF